MRRVLLLAVMSAFVVACAPRVVRPSRSLPQEVQLNLLKLPRVWVAGFVTHGRPNFDINLETTREVRHRLRDWSVSVVDAEPLVLDDESRLSDERYWRRLGEEHGEPLIVTGSVRWLIAPAKIEQRGRRIMYLTNGRALDATVVLIDGHTGEILSTRNLPRRMHYPAGLAPSGLGCLFDLLHMGIRDWLDAISAVPTTSYVGR